MKVKYIALFIVSLVVGIVFIFLSPMEYKTVVVYPTPSNVDKIQYKDKADHCYKFKAKLVNCTKDARKIPVQ